MNNHWRTWLTLLVIGNLLLLAPSFAAYTHLPERGYTGMVISITILTGLLVKLLTGAAIDRGRLRLKRTLLFAVFMTAVVAIAYVPAIDIPWLLWVVRVAHGVTFGLHLTVISTFIGKLAAVDRLNMAFGWMSATITGGFGLFGVAGVGLVDKSTILFLMTFACVAVAGVISYYLPEPELTPKSAAPFWKGIIVPDAIPFGMIVMGVTLPYGAIIAYGAGYVANHGSSALSFIGWLSITGFVGRPILAKAADWWGEPPIIFVSLGSFLGSVILLWLWPVGIIPYIAAILMGVGYAGSTTSLQVMTRKKAAAGKIESASSTFFVLSDTGMMLGPLSSLWWELFFITLLGSTILFSIVWKRQVR